MNRTAPPRWKLQFLTIWTGQAFSLIGSELVSFALIWQLTLETGSGLTLAMASAVSYLPTIALGPVAGTLVDRWNRRLIMIAADGVIALFTVFLAYLYWRGAVQVWHIYAILFLRSVGTCFHMPAMQASTPLLVPEAYLVRVAGMNEALVGVVSIVASPLAAWLLSLLSMQGILAIDVVTALVAIGTLFFVRIPQPERVLEKRARFVGDLVEGARYLLSQRGLFLMLAIDALRRLVTAPPFMMLPLLVTRHFGGGAPELGWLHSVYGLGYVLGGLILGAWGGFKRQIVTILFGLSGYGLSMLAIGAAPANGYWLALGGYLGIGGMLVIYKGSIGALLQSSVPPGMQGRVFSLKRSVENIIIPLGLLVGGPLADTVDIRLLFIVGGIACFLCAIAWASTPAIVRLERGPV